MAGAGGARARLAPLPQAPGCWWRGEAAVKELRCEISGVSWKVCGGICVHVPLVPQGRQPTLEAGVALEAADIAAGLGK